MRRRNQPTADLPIQSAAAHCEAIEVAEKVTRYESTRYNLAFSSFLDGWREGMAAAGKGELLAENDALHGAMIELSCGEREVIALRAFATDMECAVADHVEDCTCEVCIAVHKLDEARSVRNTKEAHDAS
jgi:hypothetical protein